MAQEQFDDKGFLALGLTFAAVLVVGVGCKLVGLGDEVTQAFSAVAAGVPVAVFRVKQSRRATDGRREAPIGYRIAVVGAAVLIYDTLVGVVSGVLGGVLGFLVSLGSIIPAYFVARAYAGRLRERPYVVLVGGFLLAFAARVFIAFALFPAVVRQVGEPGSVFLLMLISYGLLFASTAAGVWGARSGVPLSQQARNWIPGRPAGWATPVAESSAPPASGRFAPPASGPFAPTPGPVEQPAAEHVAPPASPLPSTPLPPTPPAGWYPDPDLRGIVRWWDGQAWTDHRRNA